MEDTKPNGGPAFPVPLTFQRPNGDVSWTSEEWDSGSGMTLRDYFAGQALNGMLAASQWFDYPDEKQYAAAAYHYADAMLKARVE